MTTHTQAHQLTLRFAISTLITATTSVKYTKCGSTISYAVTTGSGTLVPSIIYNPMVWQPQTSVNVNGNTAFIGGLQCDVYRSGTATSNLTLAFVAQKLLPLYKVRLPSCPGTLAETTNGTCSSTWTFTLEVSATWCSFFGLRLVIRLP